MTSVLAGDIGGTFARFAIVDASSWAISGRVELDTGDFSSFDDVVRACLAKMGAKPEIAAMAVAGPVTGGETSFTNKNWKASETSLRQMGFARAILINDFAALAFSIPLLGASDWCAIGPELPGLAGAPVTILGAGTGFGVSCLARYEDRAVPLATEGGHIGFAPGDDAEIEVLRVLKRRFDHVSVERVLSGPGLENLHSALSGIAGKPAGAPSAAEIVANAHADEISRAALEMFCGIYGSVAGDFALAHGASGGVYIAGGIAQKIETVLAASTFRARFESKGRLSYFVKPVPTRLILHEDAAFLGAVRAALEFTA